MSKIFGIKFNFYTLLGLCVLASAVLLGIYHLIDDIVSPGNPKENSVYNDASAPIKKHIDSIYAIKIISSQKKQDSLLKIIEKQDSILTYWEKNKTKRDETYTKAYFANIDTIFHEWAIRYK